MRAVSLAILLLLLGGCASTGVERCTAPAFAADIVTLGFGTDRVGGSPVTADEWQSFLAKEVTPRFPEGLTWWNANGQWRGENGEIVRESTYIVKLVGKRSAERDASIAAIADAYRTQFQQEAVMRVTERGCVSF